MFDRQAPFGRRKLINSKRLSISTARGSFFSELRCVARGMLGGGDTTNFMVQAAFSAASLSPG